MNHKHCGIIKDLLPLYVDLLTSEESNEAIKAHLATCENCSAIYETLKTNGDFTSDGMGKELDYLKKIKAKRKNFLLMAVGICVAVFGILIAIGVKTFIIGTPVSLEEISYTNDEGYHGIGTKFDSETNELTLYGEFLNEQLAFSGIKVEESKRLVGVYNVTVYGAPRFSDSRDHSRRFKTVIKIPDDNTLWSVYSLGEIPQDTYLIWSNAEILEQKYAVPGQKLKEYITDTTGSPSENGWLEWADFGEYGGENCWVFHWWSDADTFVGDVIAQYAVSEDGSRIYIYDSENGVWVNVS